MFSFHSLGIHTFSKLQTLIPTLSRVLMYTVWGSGWKTFILVILCFSFSFFFFSYGSRALQLTQPLMLFITSLALQQMPPDETHPGTKYIIQGRRGLARLLTKTTDQEAGLWRFEGQVTIFLLTATLNAHTEIAHVTNVRKISRLFSS